MEKRGTAKKTVIVMPVANEEDTMEDVLRQICSLPYDNLYVYPVIDSYSKDGTEAVIDRMEAQTGGKVHKIFYQQSHGVVTCYLEGFRQALADGADQIIEMDGGGSHQPCELPEFMDKLNEGYDCVFGSRFMDGGDIAHQPIYRRLLSSGGTWLSNLVLGTRLKDMTSGFEAFQRPVLAHMKLDHFLSKGHMYQTEMRFYCRHYKTVEVPIHYIGGASSLKWKSVAEALHILFCLKKNEKEVLA